MSNYPPGIGFNDVTVDSSVDDGSEDWAEDRAYEIIVDNLANYFVEYAERLEQDILETFLTTEKDWSALRETNQRSVHILLTEMAEWYVEDNHDDLYDEYQEERN